MNREFKRALRVCPVLPVRAERGSRAGAKGAIEAAGDARVDCEQRAVSPARGRGTAENQVRIAALGPVTTGATPQQIIAPYPFKCTRVAGVPCVANRQLFNNITTVAHRRTAPFETPPP